MSVASPETLFARFRATGDPAALAGVFDQLAPQLLLVAAHLLRDGSAEDLVQATFLDAIQHAQRWDPSRKLAPWLVGMLGNHLHEARRQQRRTPDATRLQQRDVEPPDVLAAANESLAAVHAAVAKLPRHYRQVLSLRLVHGLELQQIAHSLDAPLGTVKAQLNRGLALLRRALPAGLAPALAALLTPDRGLAAVRQVIVEAAGASGVTAGVVGTAALLGTGLVMKKLIVVLVAAAVLLGGWLVLRPTDPLRAVAATTPLGADAATASLAAADAAAPPTAEQVRVDPAALPSHTERNAVSQTNGNLALRVLWASDRAPAARIAVTWIDTETRTTGTQLTDAGGVLTFAELPASHYRLMAERLEVTGGGAVDVTAGAATPHELLVAGEQRLHIQVVDADGTPAAGAAVWRHGPYSESVAEPLGTADANGRLEHRGAPISYVWARRAGTQPSPERSLPDARGQGAQDPIDVRLQLGAPGCTLLGTVRSPDGATVADALVLIASDDRLDGELRELLTRTDTQGRFACDEVPSGERFVIASARGFAAGVTRVTTATERPTTVALTLLRGGTLTGRIVDSNGVAMADKRVTAKTDTWYPMIRSSWGGSRTTLTDGDGRYRLEALAPGEQTIRVSIEPMVEHHLTIADGQALTWDPVVGSGSSIVGTVLDADGQPVAGCRVQAVQAMQRAQSIRPAGGFAQTDARGTFRLDHLPDVAFRVFVHAPHELEMSNNPAARVPAAVRNDVRPGGEPLAVRLDAASCSRCWLEGSLALPPGFETEASLYLEPHALRDGGGYSVPHLRLRAGETTFCIGPLPAGSYDLSCVIEGRDQITQRDLRLAVDERRRLEPFAFAAQRALELVLRREDGSLVRGADVLVAGGWPCTEAEPGRYRSVPILPGELQVQAYGADFAPSTFAVPFAGDVPIEHTVSAATPVRLHVRPPTPRDRWLGAIRIVLTAADGSEVLRTIAQVECDGVFDWSIGLRPGNYSVKFATFDGCAANTTLTVGATPLDVDLQLLR